MDRVLDSINPGSFMRRLTTCAFNGRKSISVIPTLRNQKPADLSCLYNEEICNDIYGQSGTLVMLWEQANA
jgi:hypothetical protein